MAALVVDLGSRTSRLGWGGEAKPQHVVPTRTLTNTGQGEHFLNRGLITDWAQLEAAWSSIFTACQANPEETPVLYADYPATNDSDHEKMTEILFEKFAIPHYFVAPQSVLALYSCGRTSGVIIDAGYSVTHAMAIHEGYAYPHTIQRMEVGGTDIAKYLGNMLQDRGVDTSALDMDDLQEQVTHVPQDFIQRLRLHAEEQPALTLPDGNTVALADEHLRCGEVLFQPGLVGVDGAGLDERLWDIIRVCDSDKEGGPMRNLPQCVLLSGGLSQMPGFVPRVRTELEKRSAATRGYFIAALPGDDARNAAWIGGSILPALAGFVASNFVSQREYKEFGAAAVHRRC